MAQSLGLSEPKGALVVWTNATPRWPLGASTPAGVWAWVGRVPGRARMPAAVASTRATRTTRACAARNRM